MTSLLPFVHLILASLYWGFAGITNIFSQIQKKYLPYWKNCDRIAFVSGDGGMADALDSGSSGGNTVRVQVPFSALASGARNLVSQGFSLFYYSFEFDYL